MKWLMKRKGDSGVDIFKASRRDDIIGTIICFGIDILIFVLSVPLMLIRFKCILRNVWIDRRWYYRRTLRMFGIKR